MGDAASRALRLFAHELSLRPAGAVLLVIDEHNAASHAVARQVGSRPLLGRVIERFPAFVIYALRLPPSDSS